MTLLSDPLYQAANSSADPPAPTRANAGAANPVRPPGGGQNDGVYAGSARAQTVAVFLSFDGELDTRPLIDQLWRAGKRVYLPCFIRSAPAIFCFCTTTQAAIWW